MHKHMKLIVCAFASALVISAAPATAHAGSMTIHNENCAKGNGFQTTARVTVHVYDSKRSECTDKRVTVDAGRSKTVSLREKSNNGGLCHYKHLAKGTTLGPRDFPGNLNASVTCKENWHGACRCTKD